MAEKTEIKGPVPDMNTKTESTTPEAATAAKVEPAKDTEDPKPKEPTSPIVEHSGSTPVQTPSIATIDKMRAREDTPVTIDPKTIGKIRSPNFSQFRGGLGSVSGKKLRKDLEMSGTPGSTPTKNKYAPPVDKADFELDICAKIGAIKWDSDEDD
ncbi:hypothetical protein TWF281_002711 [Arthrobotrys megalospora]